MNLRPLNQIGFTKKQGRRTLTLSGVLDVVASESDIEYRKKIDKALEALL